jgi:hypothetical protein
VSRGNPRIEQRGVGRKALDERGEGRKAFDKRGVGSKALGKRGACEIAGENEVAVRKPSRRARRHR